MWCFSTVLVPIDLAPHRPSSPRPRPPPRAERGSAARTTFGGGSIGARPATWATPVGPRSKRIRSKRSLEA